MRKTSIAVGLVKVAGYRIAHPEEVRKLPTVDREALARRDKLLEEFGPLEKRLSEIKKDIDNSKKDRKRYEPELKELEGKYLNICRAYLLGVEETARLAPVYVDFFKAPRTLGELLQQNVAYASELRAGYKKTK
jgi:hypothetical protein